MARGLGGEVAIMQGGRIVEQGPAEQVLRRPRTVHARRLLAAEPAAWPKRPPRDPGGEVVVRAEGIAVSRGGVLLFRDLGLEVRLGEIVGLCGASGSGKSTLGDVVLGLLAPDRGSVRRRPGAARTRFQQLYQDPPAAFPPRATLGRVLRDLQDRHRLDPRALGPLMQRLQLDPVLLCRRPAQVSGGELQRLALLRVLLLDPVFLFADEPTSRLDLVTQQQTIELIVELAHAGRCGVLLASHDHALVERIADRVVAL